MILCENRVKKEPYSPDLSLKNIGHVWVETCGLFSTRISQKLPLSLCMIILNRQGLFQINEFMIWLELNLGNSFNNSRFSF